jgi:hypothetical protein
MINRSKIFKAQKGIDYLVIYKLGIKSHFIYLAKIKECHY